MSIGSNQSGTARRKRLSAAIAQIAAALYWPAAIAAPALPKPEAVLASMGKASYRVDGTKGIVDQATDRAILNWKSFDIDTGYTVEFRQPSSTSIALNRINSSVDPSRILGTLTANGQVYLYNPNGFVFGKGSRVDVNSLVASTLNISDEVFEKGMANAVDSGEPAFTGSGEVFRRGENGTYLRDEQGLRMKISAVIEDGAVLSSNADNGRILVLAPSIVNKGELNAPQGQIILAAATDKVYLQAADATATGVRGLIVEVATGGDVTNLGKMVAARGNVTLAGFAVNQSGLVSATTSVDLNGSIVLKAAEGATVDIDVGTGAAHLYARSTARARAYDDRLYKEARVTLGAGSTTEVVPELDSKATAVDEQRQDPSRVDIVGHVVHAKGGASIKARGGKVSIAATDRPDDPAAAADLAPTAGIQLDAGSVIDVSGSHASASVARNVVEVQLLSDELRDAPDQKGGPLFGKTIRVDVRTGTPLANISGAVARIQRGVAERTAAGGTIALRSNGAIGIEQGALLDTSGGVLDYHSDYVRTTRLLGADGRIYGIAEADPQRKYIGILGEVSKSYERWNVTKHWSVSPLFDKGRFEAGYSEGKAGGELGIFAPRVELNGELRGNTFDGEKQRTPSERAAGATLRIDQSGFVDAQDIVLADRETAALLAQLNSTLEQVEQQLQPEGEEVATPWLVLTDTDLAQTGFRSIVLRTGREQAATVTKDAVLELQHGGTLSIAAGSSAINGRIGGVGAAVNVLANNGELFLGETASIDVRGEWVNDQLLQGSTAPYTLDGGSVKLDARGALKLSAGSVVDVGGGARLRDDGVVEAGRAGTIALRASGGEPAAIELSGVLQGMALDSGASNKGGALSVTANRVELTAAQPPADSTALWLAPDFFQRGGFANYTITADRDGLLVGADTVIAPRAANYVLNDDYRSAASSRALADVATPTLLPAERRAPVDLALAVEHSGVDADPASALRTEAGSQIVADVGGSVALRSDSDLLLSGAIAAPAGTIDLRVTKPPLKDLLGFDLTDIGYRANQGIWLDAGATLSATGVALHTPDALGLKTGSLRDGGTVRITAERGAIVLQEGSLIDVSGASGIYSEAVLRNGDLGAAYRDVLRGSDGGSVVLTAADGALLNGELRAHGGAAPGTGGGTLALTVTPQLRNIATAATNPYPAATSAIELYAGSERGDAPLFGDDLPLEGLGIARLGTAQIAAGGFSALDLTVDGSAPDSVIRFDGAVDLQLAKRLTLDAPTIAVKVPADADADADAESAGAKATLRAAYIALGSSSARTAAAPTGGTGELRVEADLIDLVGGLTTNELGTLDLRSEGDIRLRGVAGIAVSDLVGELKTGADVLLQADQIYPATFASYTVSVLDNPEGRIAITANDSPHPVLSAAGSLTLNAPRIDQNGVLKAPFGTLTLNAAEALTLGSGSITSVSAEGQIIPFGKTLSGLEWAYDLAGGAAGSNRPIQADTPAKHIALSGRSILVDSGATLDVSGGGDLQAYEFIRGPGGSADVLDPTDTFFDAANPYVEKYALLPALQGEFAPYDAGEFSASGLEVGDSVYLSAGSGVAAGVYALLPAHYALLPGAFLVTPQSGVEVEPMAPTRTINGAQAVAGYRLSTGTQIRDSSWSRFIVEPGSAARARSQYVVTRASEFFPAQAQTRQRVALNLPADAGSVTLAAQTELSLRGAIAGDAATTAANEPGRRGQLDIAADDIAIVAQRGEGGSDRVELLDSELSRLDVGSIFIGGTRSRSSDDEGVNTALDIRARSVEVAEGTTLTAAELLLAAQQRVAIASGAILAAQSDGEGGGRLTVQGDAALVRVAGGAQVEIVHTGTAAGTASLQVAEGATLRSAGSINLDSTGAGDFDGALDMRGGALQIGAQRIVLGGANEEMDGIVLGTDLLSGLQVDTLTLNSRSQIDLAGAFDLTFKQLEVEAAGFNATGSGASTGISVLRADAVTLANPTGASGVFDDGAERSLLLDSGLLTLGDGDFALRGFTASDLSARQGILVEGSGRLLAGGDLTLRAPSISAAAAADYGIEARRDELFFDVRLLPLAGSGGALPAGLGGRLRVEGGSIDAGEAGAAHALSLLAPAGGISLRAHSGDVTLARGVNIDVAGRQVLFADRLAFAAGGNVDIAADTGAVVVAEGARIDVSGASAGGDAGALSLAAPGGEVRLDGELAAHAAADATGGRFALDAQRIDSVATLNTRLAAAGFDGAIELRQRLGDLLVEAGTELRAHAIRLVADFGQLRIDGALQASGQRAGTVVLAAGGDVTISSNASIEARASGVNERGGKVFIDSVGGVGADGGGIEIQAGATIDVRGGLLQETTEVSDLGTIVYGIDGGVVEVDGAPYRAGDILLRAPRTADSLNLQVEGNWHGATRIDAEAVRIYDLDAIGEIDTATIAGYRSDTADYMSGIVALGENIALLPGIELRASESLTLNALWDLAAWRYADEAGVLTLRSGGDLAIGANLTDAFKRTGSRNTLFNNALQEGTSWSYRLIGGGDLASADLLATVSTDTARGSVALSNGAFVRTGTGFIDVAAAGDLTFADNRSAIYTVGRKLANNGKLDRDNPYGTLGPFVSQPTRGFYAEFPVDGGDIGIEVGGNIVGATSSTLVDGSESHQFITDWWVKESSNLGYTGWGIAIDLPASMNTATSKTGGGRFDRILNARSGFRQGIGALAGGDIAIRAGGDLLDVSVAIPTTGKPISPRSEDGATLISRAVLVNGGGNLAIEAGGDIAGGLIFVGAGNAELKAGGDIRGGSQYTSGTVFALGDTALAARAGGKLQVGAVFDPGLLTSVYSTQPGSYFLTYGPRSAVELTAVGGGVELHNDIELLAANALRYTVGSLLPTPYLVSSSFLSLYPARVTAQSLSGDIDVLHNFTLAPAANGTLNLLAAGDIQSGQLEGVTVDINLADSDPALFPSVLKPGSLIGKEGLLLINDVLTGLSHASTPVHTGDDEPARIVALDGDIRANNRLSIGLSKPALIAAGRDIVDVDFALQNLDAADLTTIQVGRDIRYGIDFNPVTGALNPIDKSIVLSGPGRFEFVAGRDIDLGASNGIVALGNLRNSVLPSIGASLGLYTGFNDADYAGFTTRYLGKSDTYAPDLLAYVAAQGGSAATKQEALEFFATLPTARQRKLLTDIFFDELRAAGAASAQSGERAPLQRGLDAIAALFPARDATARSAAARRSDATATNKSTPENDGGDVKLFLSRVATLAGGDVDMLAPAGLVNAGLASSSLNSKSAAELGIVAQSEGDVNVFVKDGLQVNQSRVFALGGGSITAWSTDGDIDAGRGSKAALSAPPPIIGFDDRGNLRITYPPAVSGSGIRTAAPAGRTRGNVYLFTVNGSINLGEAGISGNDVYLVGPIIDPGGGLDFNTAVGAPTASVSLAPGLAAVSSLDAGVAQAAVEQKAAPAPKPALATTHLLTAQLLGFGDYSLGAIRDGDFSEDPDAIQRKDSSASP